MTDAEAIKKLESIVKDLDDADRGAILYLKQSEINSLRTCLRLLKKYKAHNDLMHSLNIGLLETIRECVHKEVLETIRDKAKTNRSIDEVIEELNKWLGE